MHPAQLALARLHHQGDDVRPIPRTTKFEQLNENIEALTVKLAPEEMAEHDSIALADVVKGDRHPDTVTAYKDSDTPPLS